MKRKILSVLLALSMVLTLFPTAVLADGGATENEGGTGNVTTYEATYTYTIGDDTAIIGYASKLAEAVEKVNDGGTLTLQTGIELTEELVLPKNKTFKLDLGAYNITQTVEGNNAIILDEGDNVTITGTGKITGKKNGVYVPKDAKLTIDGAKIEASVYNGIYNEGTTIVDSGTLTGGSEYSEEDKCTYYYNGIYSEGALTVNGGTVNKIYAYEGAATITGGTVNGRFYFEWTTVRVEGGSIKGDLEGAGENDGITATGGTFDGSVFAKSVTGGTFNGALTLVNYSNSKNFQNCTINGSLAWDRFSKAPMGTRSGLNIRFGENASIATEHYFINAERNGIDTDYLTIRIYAGDGGSMKVWVDTTSGSGSSSYKDEKVEAGLKKTVNSATVTANSGYKFDGWYLKGNKITDGVSEDGSLTNYELTVTENTDLVARFISLDYENNAATKFAGSEVTLSSYDDWDLFTYAVTNLGYTFEGKTVKLDFTDKLLNFAGKTYKVVGSNEHPFKGTFDGNDHTITGITKTENTTIGVQDLSGLFGQARNATFKNLTLKDCSFAGYYAGGIVADAYAGVTIENCRIENVATSGWFSGAVTGHTYGGLKVKDVTIIGCSAAGTKGGMVTGYSEGVTMTNVQVSDVKAGAALIGHANAGENVIENAKVDAPKASLIGMTYSESTGTITITGDDTVVKAKSVIGGEKSESKTVTIEAGTFTSDDNGTKLDVRDYLADGMTQDENGLIGEQKIYVAELDGRGCESIGTALTEWATNGGTLKLLKDCSTDQTYTGIKTATLDLNGCTLLLTSQSSGVFIVDNGGATLTIQDSGSGGKIKLTSPYAQLKAYPGGKIVINGGTVETATYYAVQSPTSFTMTAGTLQGGTKGLNVSGGSAAITGGKMNGIDVNGSASLTLGTEDETDYAKVRVNGTVEIDSGATVNFNSCLVDNLTVADTATVSFTENAYFTQNVTVAGYLTTAVTVGSATYYQLTPTGNAAAEVTHESATTKYATLAAAMIALQDGDALKLLKNAETAGSYNVDACNVTIDLNGFNSAALALNLTAEETSGSVNIVNSSTTTSTITGEPPLTVTTTRTDLAVQVTIDEKVTLTATDGGDCVVLGGGAYLPYTEANAGYIKNGGFKVKAAESDERIYGSLAVAKNAGSTITLLNDYTTSGEQNIMANWGDVTLNLNGHTYRSTQTTGNMFDLHEDGAKITIMNGTLEGAGSSVIGSGVNDASMTLTNVTIEATGYYAIATNGTCTNNTITLTDCTIKAPNGMGIYFPSTGKLTIDGGSITAKNGVQLCAGSLEIKGNATITATGPALADDATFGADGSIEDGAAVSIVHRSGYGTLGTVKIESGSFAAADGVDAVQAYTIDENSEKTDFDNTNHTISVSGGTFTNDPNKYLAEGACGKDNKNGTYTVAASHTVVTDAKVEATCTKDGKTEGSHCSMCGEIFTPQETIPAKGHTEVIDAAVEATCTEDGKTEGKHCSVCNTVLIAQTTVSATGHNWGEWEKVNDEQHKHVCTNDASHVETTNHAWDDGVVTTQPTTSSKGVKTYTCTDCGATKTVDVDKLPSGGSSGSSSGSTTTKTETTTNPDGSITKTETKADGTTVETTTNTDGSTTTTETKTETKADGSTVETKKETSTAADGSKTESKTETTTTADGSKTETKSETKTEADGTKTETEAKSETKADGTTTSTETKKTTDVNGSTGTTTTTNENGNTKTEAEAKISEKAVEDAKKSGEAVKVPTEVKAGENSNSAPTVKIELPENVGGTKVEIPVSDVNSGTVAVIVNEDGTEEIVKNSTVTEDGVVIGIDGNATVKIIDNSKDFIDTRNHWSRDEVNFVAARELFNGIGNNLFGVSGAMTRGMVNTVLARLAGVDTTPAADQKWYEPGTEWAKKNGITDGSNPEASVTREQLAAMLHRFAGSPAVSGTLSFADADQISDYAKNSLLWAVQNGIMNGIGDNLVAPTAGAERAQVAAMMARYLKNVG